VSFLLDTNVISEWVKPRPDPRVIRWLEEIDEDRTFLSVASLAEIRQGIELLPDGRRRDRLDAWLVEDLPGRFEGRILPIDRDIAETWGILMVRGKQSGVTLGSIDAFFAATAEARRLTLATRHTKDFATIGISLCKSLEFCSGDVGRLGVTEPPPI
jgi:predicted nucleic acid-binding protein